MNIKQTVCTVPWNSIYINDGKVNLCCNTTSNVVDNFNRVADIESLNTIKNQNYYLEVKHDMLNGIQTPACDRCWKMEPHSFRTTVYNKNFPETYDLICTDKPQDLPLEQLSISIGNICNLNCRMCDPGSSSMIAKEWKNNPHPEGTHNIYEKYIATDFKERENFLGNSKFLDFIKKNVSHLKDVYISGGEPFIIVEEHIKFLQLLVDLDVAKNIKLSYSTNGTNTNMRRFIDILKQFKQVVFSISTDGIEECYDYIRWPSTWVKHFQNLQFYKQITKENKNFCISLACTVQSLNIKKLPKFEKWAKENDFNIFYIPVNRPDYLSLNVVPKNILKKVLNETTNPQLHSIITPFIQNYNQEFSLQLFEKFKKVNLWQDKYRDQNLYSFYPEIKEWHNEDN